MKWPFEKHLKVAAAAVVVHEPLEASARVSTDELGDAAIGEHKDDAEEASPRVCRPPTAGRVVDA